MANNRLILQCKCKKDYGVVLAKHYDRGWFTQDYNKMNGNPPVDLREDLNEYYEEHNSCFHELGDDCLHLCTEYDHEILKEGCNESTGVKQLYHKLFLNAPTGKCGTLTSD